MESNIAGPLDCEYFPWLHLSLDGAFQSKAFILTLDLKEYQTVKLIMDLNW